MSSNNDLYEMEKILFWFYESQKLRLKSFCKREVEKVRDYSIDDVAICIKRLFLAGVISKNHLNAFKKVCETGIIPDERREDEREIFLLWKSFLEAVLVEFSQKGWLEKSPCKIA